MRSWAKIRGEVSAESRKRMDAELKKRLASMPLEKLRKARSMTQSAVAARLQIDQGRYRSWKGGRICI